MKGTSFPCEIVVLGACVLGSINRLVSQLGVQDSVINGAPKDNASFLGELLNKEQILK